MHYYVSFYNIRFHKIQTIGSSLGDSGLYHLLRLYESYESQVFKAKGQIDTVVIINGTKMAQLLCKEKTYQSV